MECQTLKCKSSLQSPENTHCWELGADGVESYCRTIWLFCIKEICNGGYIHYIINGLPSVGGPAWADDL